MSFILLLNVYSHTGNVRRHVYDVSRYKQATLISEHRWAKHFRDRYTPMFPITTLSIFLCHLHLLNTMLTIELPFILIFPCLSHYPYCISQQNHLYILILDFNYLSSLFASLKLVNLILTRSHRTSLPHAQVSYLSALFPTELCFNLFPIQCCICILRASQRPLCDLLIFCITFVLVLVL